MRYSWGSTRRPPSLDGTGARLAGWGLAGDDHGAQSAGVGVAVLREDRSLSDLGLSHQRGDEVLGVGQELLVEQTSGDLVDGEAGAGHSAGSPSGEPSQRATACWRAGT